VAATADARAPRDVRGQTLPVRFEVVDRRPPLVPPGGGNDTRGPYQVAVMLQARRRGLPAWARRLRQPAVHSLRPRASLARFGRRMGLRPG